MLIACMQYASPPGSNSSQEETPDVLSSQDFRIVLKEERQGVPPDVKLDGMYKQLGGVCDTNSWGLLFPKKTDIKWNDGLVGVTISKWPTFYPYFRFLNPHLVYSHPSKKWEVKLSETIPRSAKIVQKLEKKTNTCQKKQGLVTVPFWVYWTSPYSSHYRPYT